MWMGMLCSAARDSNSAPSTSPRSIWRSDCSRLLWLISSRTSTLISSAHSTAHFLMSSLSPCRHTNTGWSSEVPISVMAPYMKGVVGFASASSGMVKVR